MSQGLEWEERGKDKEKSEEKDRREGQKTKPALGEKCMPGTMTT